MEHIDALEAVRRLTLERDALAEQVRRLEGGDAIHRTTGEKTQILCACCHKPITRWLFCDDCEARAKTDAETGEGGNGAARGCNAPPRTCEGCKHWIENTRPGYMSTGYCHSHAPIANPDGPEALAHFPLTAHNVRCGEWEAK